MSEQSAADVIASALDVELDEHGHEDDAEKRGQVAHHFADTSLAALEAAGYAVEKLPERLVHATGCSWKAGKDSVYYERHSSPVSAIVCETGAGEAQLVYPDDPRALGVALLAAAREADK